MSNLNPSDINGLLHAMYPSPQKETALITEESLPVPRKDDQPIMKNSDSIVLDAIKIASDSTRTNANEVVRIIQDSVDNARTVFNTISTDPRRHTWGKKSYFDGITGQIVSGSPLTGADETRLEVVTEVGKIAQGIANAPGAILNDIEEFMFIAGIGVVVFGGLFLYNQAKQAIQ